MLMVVSCVVPAFGQSRGAVTAGAPAGPSESPASEPVPETAFGPEYCEILERWNADKEIPDAPTRNRAAGRSRRYR